LGNLNESEDVSSDLCGFEIQKLLTEQKKLEKNYADLIKQRCMLKGLKNKTELNKIQEKIMIVSSTLSKSTSKLCRLFKENTSIENDEGKVKAERSGLLTHLDQFMANIQQNTFDDQIDWILEELEGQNKLSDNLNREKQLTKDIKEIKNLISEETKIYKNEMIEKDATIQNLKEQLAKSRDESKKNINYDRKDIKTKEATNHRINTYAQKKIIDESKNNENLSGREKEVFDKIKNFLEKDESDIKNEAENWVKNLDKEREQLENKIEKIQLDTKKAKEKLEILTDEYNLEMQEQELKMEFIRNKFADKDKEDKKERMIDENIRLLQREFETW